MKHYVAYLNGYRQRIELDAPDYITAQKKAAMLLDTRREREIYLIETTDAPTED